MKKLLLGLLIGLNGFSGTYYLINYKGKNYKALENKYDLYTYIEINKYQRSLLNKYTQKYKVIRRLTDEEIRNFNCSPVYSKCK